MTATQNTKTVKWLAQMEVLFKACADQTRLRILNMLASEGEICVCHLVEVLKTNQPKVSRHLAYLKRAGLVTDRKDGLWVYYRLAVPLTAQAESVLRCLASCCAEIPEMQQDLRRLQGSAQSLVKRTGQQQAVSLLPAVKAVEVEARLELQVELL